MKTETIATKFVRHDVPELQSLQYAKVYVLREKLNKGEKMNRAEEKLACRSRKPKCLFQKSSSLAGLSVWV